MLLAEAILRHRPFPLAEVLQLALVAPGEYVVLEEENQLQHYAGAIDIVPVGRQTGFSIEDGPVIKQDNHLTINLHRW